ncbi:MAG: hypothetical protein FJW79_02610 [Actinobacteria bacterium]|nr:hypothetical protein [Actinomycetota bacterium]
MTEDVRPPSEDPTEEVTPPPALPDTPTWATSPAPGRQRSRLGHVVLGAVLLLIGVGWLLEALEVADVPWRFLLPSVLVLVGLALTLGARSGRHGGLLAVGVVLTVLVLLAAAVEVLIDIPLAAGIGDATRRPSTAVEEEYRWGMGQMTLDLSEARGLEGRQIAASVVLGELVVILPENVPLVLTVRAGLGEVSVPGASRGGVEAVLECRGNSRGLACDGSLEQSERALQLDLRVAVGQVEVRR